MKSRLFRLVSLLVIMSMIVMPASAKNTSIADYPTDGSNPQGGKYQQVEAVPVSETGRYVVLLQGESLLRSAAGKSDLNSVESQAYLTELRQKQDAFVEGLKADLGHEIKVQYRYDVILNGLSIEASAEEAAKIAGMPFVRQVLPVTIEHPDTDAGPEWIGADNLWDGSSTPNAVGSKGEGVIVGILDTGINFDHPSFADPGPVDGYAYPTPAKYLGVCDSGNAQQYDPAYATACNDKLIGGYTYIVGEAISPEDSEGHGSHTASTVAGNQVSLTFLGVPVTISGVAPHAQIIAYDVCDADGCYGDASAAATQQAILDGVKVINYSISGGKAPYSDVTELAFLDASDAGIFVATSAGNLRTEPSTNGQVNHLSPWVMTVAASSHNRKFTNDIDVVSPTPVPATYTNMAMITGSSPLAFPALNDVELVWAGEDTASSTAPFTDNRQGCNPFPTGYFTGKVALIRRGTCNFAVKVNNAANAGAIGALIYADARPPISPGGLEATTIPAGFLYLSSPDATAFAAWMDTHAPVLIDMTANGRVTNDAWGDIKADFSFRGPGANNFEVLKPEITAPGLEILAAVSDGTIPPSGTAEFELLQGTSMSSPHTAGAAALVKALHPTWTPAMIKSAIMLTAKNTGLIKEDMVTPADAFDFGAGRVNLTLAGLTGLVMKETTANYQAADPALGGDPKTLNLPSLQSNNCVGTCSWTRTFTSVANAPATYVANAPAWITVTPNTFTIAPGANQVVTFEANVAAMPVDAWAYGTVSFETTSHFAGTGAPTTLLNESFTDTVFPPTNWAIYDVDAVGASALWQRNTTYSSTAPASARHQYGCSADQEGWMVTPQVAVPLVGITTINFQQRGDYTGDLVYHGVLVSTGSALPSSGQFVEVAQPATPPEDAWTTTPVQVDLSAYAGQNVYVAFKYTGNCADTWWVDDVQVVNTPVGEPISDVHLPLAVMPTAGNLPELATFYTYRDADGVTLTDLQAIAISTLTIDTYGLAVADLNTITLNPDPTPADAFDNLSQVYWTNIPVPAYSMRLVNEITQSTSNDIDLYVGYDLNGNGHPDSNEVVAKSATGAVLEYVNVGPDWVYWNADDQFWVLVQNWDGAVGDTVTLATGVVPGTDEGNLTVSGPTSNPAGALFDLNLAWDEDTEEGDRMYAYLDVYADSTYTNYIGFIQLDVRRGPDDVVKTVSRPAAKPGDTVTYTITLNNYKSADAIYDVVDAIPDGLTYVPGSVTGGAVYSATTNSILWSGVVPGASFRDYVMTTSAVDPACTLGIMADGNPADAYLDWKTTSYAFSSSSSISGDTFWYNTFSAYPAFNFYGVDYTGGLQFTADGYTLLGGTGPVPANQDLPDPANPNNVMAMFWRDLVVTYDLATNKGVTMVGDSATFATIEYDDVALKSDPTKTLDFEIGYFLQPDDTPGAYEIIFAYDNITPGTFADNIGTVGVENADGTLGTQYAYNSAALATLQNGMAICFDYAIVPPPATVITFQVTVDADNTYPSVTNIALHDTDDLNTVVESASVDLIIGNATPVAVDDTYAATEDVVLNVPALTGLLANDFDIDGDTMMASLLADPTHGTVEVFADGSFTYTPDKDFNGVDTFTYRLVTFPAKAWIDDGMVTINVAAVNDAPVASVIADVDWLARVAHTYAITPFTDVDGDTLTYSATSNGGALPAWLTINPATGAFSGTPSNDNVGDYDIVVTASDGHGGTATSPFELTVLLNPFLTFLPVVTK